MNILLTAINAKYIHSNLAVYSLKAYAGEQDSRIGIAEYTINQNMDEILSDIYIRNPQVICISCYIWNIRYVRRLIREIPKIMPNAEIWLGGPEVSYCAKELLEQFTRLRGIMCGEGEETFRELTQMYFEEMIKAEDIKGIVYRDAEGNIHTNPLRPVMDLSRVPFVYSHVEDFKNRIIYYESSRGCPFSCSYCLSSVDKCLRFRDIELVKKELQFFIDHEVPQVKFVDRTFNCRHEHAGAVWRYIKEHDRGITNFHFEVAADLLTDEEIDLIREMRPGLIQLEIGVQSTNEDTIREIRRKMDLGKVERSVAKIRSGGGVHQHLDLIAGLPFEDYESFSQSFNRVYAMRPEQLQLGFLKVLKGSLMHEKAQEYGLLYQDSPPYEVLSTKWLSYGDVIRLKRVEEMVEVYYNSCQFRHTLTRLEEEFPSPFSMYEALAEYYRSRGLFKLSHSRLARYEILYDFIGEHCAEKREEYREWLTLDLYLRDNVKNRPGFLGGSQVSKEEASAFYKREAGEFRYLKGYEGCDRSQLRRMTHLERVKGRLLLFDYKNRNRLTGDASICRIEDQKGKENEFL